MCDRARITDLGTGFDDVRCCTNALIRTEIADATLGLAILILRGTPRSLDTDPTSDRRLKQLYGHIGERGDHDIGGIGRKGADEDRTYSGCLASLVIGDTIAQEP